MIKLGASLDRILETAHLFPHIRKDELSPGDLVVIRTVKSKYTLRFLGGGLYEARGGWFDKRGHAPLQIGVAGATWGGSVIMPHILAACGMRIEFKNRLITSPVRFITVIPRNALN